VQRKTAFHNWLTRGRRRCLPGLTLACLVVACGTAPQLAPGQDLESIESQAATADSLLGEAPSDQLLLDAAPAAQAAPFAGYVSDSEFDAEAPPVVRPVNWISGPYLRGGVNFVIGESIFDQRQDVGYGISGGYRQPLGPEIGGDRFFFDLGGSYQEARGIATTQNIQGTQLTRINGVVVDADFFPTAFSATLEELRRGSLHAALGWFWGEGLDNRSRDPQIRVATRVGGRVGHARGGFDIQQHIFAPPPPNIATTITLDRDFFNRTDTYGGLFVGTEAILLQRQFSFGHFQWTLDGEFANDWIELGEGRWEGSLGTASVMMGFMLSR
jgi:hypothetical protein